MSLIIHLPLSFAEALLCHNYAVEQIGHDRIGHAVLVILIKECLSLRAVIGPYKHGLLPERVYLNNFKVLYTMPVDCH